MFCISSSTPEQLSPQRVLHSSTSILTTQRRPRLSTSARRSSLRRYLCRTRPVRGQSCPHATIALAPGRRPRSRAAPPAPTVVVSDDLLWGAPGELPPRLPYPPHHPPLLRRAAAASAASAAASPPAPRRGRFLHRHRSLGRYHDHVPVFDSSSAARLVPRHAAWEYPAPAVRGMPVMFEEQVDWETPYDPSSHSGARPSARRRIASRRRFGRLSSLFSFRVVRRGGMDGEDGEDDPLELTYEELLELDDRNVRCGLSEDELAELRTFTAGKEHMNQICHICLDGVEYGLLLVELECAHVFHKRCIHTWLTRKRSCPICRSEI